MEANTCEVGDYFFQTKELHDVHFLVGKGQERIPAVSSQLINQSRVWWSMLAKDSPLVEKGEISLPDVEPEIFKLLLKHSYGGLEDCSGLTDDDKEELCRCADKYLMNSLKNKMAASLKPTDVDGMFRALHCIAHYNLSADNEAVKRIVQTQTLEIFAHPLFLECDEDSVSYITRQDRLGCEEIKVWQAVVKWAKNKAGNEDGAELRESMVHPLRHIRLFTLSNSDLVQHVIPTNILTGSEVASICRKKRAENYTLCDKTEIRPISTRPYTSTYAVQSSGTFNVDIKHKINEYRDLSFSKITSAYFVVKKENIRIKHITCEGLLNTAAYGNFPTYFNKYSKYIFEKKDWVNIIIRVRRVTDFHHNSSDEEPTVIDLRRFEFHHFDRFKVPVNTVLQADNKYNIELHFSASFPCLISPNCEKGHEFEHGWFYCSPFYQGSVGTISCHVLEFEYDLDTDD